jgi:hypothetical protein
MPIHTSSVFGDQAQGGIRHKARIRHSYHLLSPCWGHKVLQHLPQQDVLMASTCRGHRGEGHRAPETPPTGDEQPYLNPKRLRLMLAVRRHATPGMLSPPLGLPCAVPEPIQDPIRRQWKRTERGRG